MEGAADQGSGVQGESRRTPAEAAPTEVKATLPAAAAPQAAYPEQEAAPRATPSPGVPPKPSAAGLSSQRRRKLLLPTGVVIGLTIGGYLLVPWLVTALNTVSTDDAYVNGHVTFVAARVPGQVASVLVDDNYRVRNGDLLVELDKEPYRVELEIKKAAVATGKAALAVVRAQVRGIEAQARSRRFKLQHTIEAVDNQIALLAPKWPTCNRRKQRWHGRSPIFIGRRSCSLPKRSAARTTINSRRHCSLPRLKSKSRSRRSTRFGPPWG